MGRKTLTREEFENGATFYIKDDDWHSYRYRCPEGEYGGYIYRDGKFLCSVCAGITGEGFHVFAHVLNIPVSGFVKFESLWTKG